LAFLLVVLAACERKPTFEPPAPSITIDVDSLPALPASIIDAPLTYDLTPIVAELERVVPKKLGDLNKKVPLATNKRVHIAFAADREPFALKLDGDLVRMTAIVNYSGRVWYNPPIGPEVSAACGQKGQMPRIRIEVVTPVRLTSDWKLRSRTTVKDLAPMTNTEVDQCEMTFLKIDVTGKVIDAVRKLLEKNTRVVDAKVASINLRPKFEEFWSVLSEPIHLSDSLWLVINPTAVQVGPATGSKRMLRTGVALTAEPRIVAGRKPTVDKTPLPKQTPVKEIPDGFHVLLEGLMMYDVASNLLSDELKGKRVKQGRRYIEVRSVRMFGVGGGKIGLEVNFAGTTGGRIFFVGTPNYDYKGDRLYVPDLDYDVASAHAILRGLSWLKHDDLRDYLRSKARWPVGGLIKQGEAELKKGLNQELSKGVKLSGDTHEVEIIGVHAGKDAVVVRAHADGNVRLDVTSKH
jgi:hypothetical protein